MDKKPDRPKVIYLMDFDDQVVWADDAALSDEIDPDESDKYIHEDNVEEMTAMLKVFKGCIEVDELPNEGSPCYKKLCDLITNEEKDNE